MMNWVENAQEYAYEDPSRNPTKDTSNGGKQRDFKGEAGDQFYYGVKNVNYAL